MPFALHSFKIDDDGEVRVSHTFYANTESKARKAMAEHADGCPSFGPALRSNKTIELVEEIDAMPEAEEDELISFLGLEEEDEEEEEEHEK